MGFSAVNNVSAITAQRSLGLSQSSMDRTLNRLATGLRINRAADDAAGLAISSGLRADIRAMEQGIRNANDGISVVQVTEGALEEMNTILTRMKELAEQGASDTSGADDGPEKEALQAEVTALISEIDRIRDSTTFLGRNVLQAVSLEVQVGIGSGTENRIDVDTGGGAGLDVTSANLGVDTVDVSTGATARTALDAIDSAIGDVAQLRGDLGAAQARLATAARNQGLVVEEMTAADSRIRDADLASEVVNLTKAQILTQTGMSALAQANAQSQQVLQLLQ